MLPLTRILNVCRIRQLWRMYERIGGPTLRLRAVEASRRASVEKGDDESEEEESGPTQFRLGIAFRSVEGVSHCLIRYPPLRR